MLNMKFPPTTQQLEEAGFEKGQAEALAACFASQDQKLDGIIMLLQHLAQKVDAVEKKVDATNQKVDATNQKLVDFQLDTERKFSETNQKISDTKSSLIMWMVGAVIGAVVGVSTILSRFL